MGVEGAPILEQAPQSVVSARRAAPVNVGTVLDPRSLPPTPLGDTCALLLVEIIELKWLLAGVGIHLHVERLQHDRAYALRALEAASASASPAAQVLARRLRDRLNAAP